MTQSQPHQGLLLPFPRESVSRQLYIAGILAKMAYVHKEPELLKAMGAFLGFDNLQWIQTPGDITVNFLVGTSSGGAVIVFSGTENVWQMIYYCLLSIQNGATNDFQFNVHQGFYKIFEATIQQLLAALPPANQGVPVTLIGHSLGGALAQLWAYIFYYRLLTFPITNLITFGSPAVGNFVQLHLMSSVPRTMVRHEWDLVPFLPPTLTFFPRFGFSALIPLLFYSYSRLSPQLVLNYGGSCELRNFPFNDWDWQRAGRILEVLSNPGIAANATDLSTLFDDHFMDSYLDWMKRWLQRNNLFTDLDFADAILAQMNALQVPGQDVTELEPGSLNSLIRSLNPPSPNVTPSPLPPTFSVPETVQAGNAFTVDGPTIHRQTTFDATIVPWSTRPGNASSAFGGAVDPALFGEPQRPFWLFRGKDREILTTLQRLLSAMQLRDNRVLAAQIADSPDPGTFFIDPTDDTLTAAFQTLSDRVDLLLGFQRQNI